MAAPHRQRVAVGVEELAVESLEGVADRDHHVDAARELGVEDGRAPPWHHVDPHVRRRLRDLLHQRRHQEFDREVRHHQAELPVASGCVECIGLEQAADLIEHLGERPAQALCARRQLHAGAGPHQQGIAEQVAQSLQRVARSRLRQPDPHRGAADTGFPQQRVERHQQVEVKRFQIHQVNIYHAILSIGRMACRCAMIGASIKWRRCHHDYSSQQATSAAGL